MKKLSVILLMASLTVGCTNVDKLKKLHIDPSKGFNQALASNYRDLAESEAKLSHWSESRFFGDKSIKAYNDETVLPEDPVKWKLPAKESSTLKWAYERLSSVISHDAKKEYPQKTAKVQSLYDCWLKQQSENRKMDKDANSCRMDFLMELAELENQLTPNGLVAVTVEKLDAPASGPVVYKDVIYFASGSTKLKNEAQRVIDDVFNKSKELKGFLIKVSGYTDTVGNESYNLALSKARAKAVADSFVKKGISAESIETDAFGESKLALETKDSTAEAKNRRVEVDLNAK
jgi:outer membrane protein OmpA-like peptidoglycan-associated protein